MQEENGTNGAVERDLPEGLQAGAQPQRSPRDRTRALDVAGGFIAVIGLFLAVWSFLFWMYQPPHEAPLCPLDFTGVYLLGHWSDLLKFPFPQIIGALALFAAGMGLRAEHRYARIILQAAGWLVLSLGIPAFVFLGGPAGFVLMVAIIVTVGAVWLTRWVIGLFRPPASQVRTERPVRTPQAPESKPHVLLVEAFLAIFIFATVFVPFAFWAAFSWLAGMD